MEYPIIDGIPILVPDLRAYVSQNILPIMARTDLDRTVESLVGDCCGPGSGIDTLRQHLSTYGHDHYGDLDPDQPPGGDHGPGAVVRLLNKALDLAGEDLPEGPVVDAGCAVGRGTFELAQRLDRPVLGVDLNFHMLRTAAMVMNHGRVNYPFRRVGLVYDRKSFPIHLPAKDRVDFWACDATCLPFGEKSMALAASLNLVDCVASPYDHLVCLAKILMPGGAALMTTPFDWSANATPVEAWLGGHSQRWGLQGRSEAFLDSLLSGGSHPNCLQNLGIQASEEGFQWPVRLHDRSRVVYTTRVMALRAL